MRGDFIRQQRESTVYGRVLYPLFIVGLLLVGSVFIGLVDRSVRSAVGWGLAEFPILAAIAFLPRRSRD